MTVLNADDLDKCAILWATVAYSVANLDDILPRGVVNSALPGPQNNCWLPSFLFAVSLALWLARKGIQV